MSQLPWHTTGSGQGAALLLLAPIVPEKAESWRRLMQALAGSRRTQHAAARRRQGVHAEYAWISETRQRAMGVIMLAADRPWQALAELAEAPQPFDCWFREQLTALQGIDLGSLAPANLPELVFTWYDEAQKGSQSMSTEQNANLLRRWWSALSQGRAAAIIDEVYTPDYTLHDPTLPGPVQGRAGVHEFIASVEAGFPGAQYTIEELLAVDDKVVQRLTVRGTHQGEFMGIPATGNTVTVWLMVISRIAGGQIAEEWQLLDSLGLMQQLGVIPTE